MFGFGKKRENTAADGLRRLNAWMAFGLVGIIAISSFVIHIFAAQLNNRKDLMGNQTKGQKSSHSISFNLSGGNTFVFGETLAFDFPETGGFSMSADPWTAADFSFSDNVGARTIAGVNQGPGITTVVCPDGANNVGVAVDTAALAYRVMPCGAGFTASGAGAFITFTIDGNNPNGQLINPSTAGSYIIQVLDGAGDCQTVGDVCGIPVAIVDNQRITVTAQVGVFTGGGGNPVDTTPPQIINIRIENETATTADVCWDTTENADSTVNYGLTNTYGTQKTAGAYVTTRCVTIDNLTEGQTYHFQVCSKDQANNNLCSGDQTFTLADNHPPIITNVVVSSVTCNSASLSWTTDEPSTTYVDYGPFSGPPYSTTAGNNTMTTQHNLLLTGLASGATFHYRVRSADAATNESFTANATFGTMTSCVQDTTPPAITNVTVTQITQTTARVCWDTNEIADGRIDYGDTPQYGSNRTDGNFLTTRCIDLTGLAPGTVYHYLLTSKDPSGNAATTTDLTFQTLNLIPGQCSFTCSDAKFYPYIINPDGTVRKFGSNYVQVTEVSPGVTRYNFEDKGSDFDYNDVIVTVRHADCSNVIFEADLGDAAWHHVIRAEVYYQNVLRKDQLLWTDSQSAENAPRNVDFSSDAAICEGTPPEISNVRVIQITETSAIVTWDTLGSPSDSTIEYGTTLGYGQTIHLNSLVVNHSIVLGDLTKGTLYHFRVSSEDAQDRSAISTDQTFTTLTDGVAPANVTGLTATAGDSVVNLAWTNPADADFRGVRIVRSATGYPTGPDDGTVVYSGTGTSFVDNGVTNGITYYYALFSFDDVPNYSSGAVATATPSGAPDTTPPGNVVNLVATPGDAQVMLTWTNPASADFQGVRLVRKEGGNPTGVNDGLVIYQGPNSAYLDTAVVNGTTYYYGVFAYDAIPNYASGAFASATPNAGADVTPPPPVTNLVATPGNAQVLLTWTNPTSPDWVGTKILRKTTGFATNADDPAATVVYDGPLAMKMDNFVTNGTRYYYSAFAYDARPNFAAPATAEATPQGDLEQPPTPMCGDTDGGHTYAVAGTVTRDGRTEADTCVDSATLTEWFCANDQVQSESYACGSGFKCSSGRCVAEDYVPTVEVCGNGFCRESENSINCSADCPVVDTGTQVEPPAVTAPADIRLVAHDLRFLATSGNIQLRIEGTDLLRYYNNAVMTVMIPDPSIRAVIASAYVNLDNRSYRMRQTASYETSLITPMAIGFFPMEVIVNYVDGSSDVVKVTLQTIPRPRVLDSDTGEPVQGARVSLYVREGSSFGLWNATPYGQQNPQFTDDEGKFAYILPIGSYKLIIEKEGYRTRETLPFPNTTENVALTDYDIIKLPLPDDIPAQIEYIGKVVEQTIRDVVDNVYVEDDAREIAAPAATIATVANVAAAGIATASVFFLPAYLLSLLTHPFLLIARRRRKQWGVVYNSLSKLPIDLAIVRLLDARSGRIVRSAVTDKNGRYFFIVQPGTYKMVAVKNAYVFPSSVLRGMKEDQKYVDLYHGEDIVVTKETTITANIPLDPIGAEKTPARLRWEGFARGVQQSLGLFAIAAMLVATIIAPSPLMYLLLAGNIVMYALFRRLAIPPRPKNWGIVYDDKSKKPLPQVVARIFDARFNKLLETQVTDARGRYAFLVGQNTYYVTFEKLGYEKAQKGPVDLKDTSKQTTHLVAVDVPLVYTGKKSGGSGAPVVPPAVAFSAPVVPAAAAPVAPAPVVPPAAPASAAPAAPATPAAAPAKDGMSYAAKMMARLKGSKEAAAAPAAPAVPSKPTPSETPSQLVKDIADELSGARNGTELPTPEQAHPPEPPAKDGAGGVDKDGADGGKPNQ